MHHATIGHYNFKLDPAADNYSRWKRIFYSVLCKYHVQDHVDEESDPLPRSAEWRHADITIVLWLYATISDDIRRRHVS